MAAICKLVELIVSLCMIVFISVSQSVLQSDDIYHITKNPDLPSDYANEADSSYSDVGQVIACVKHCTRSSSCEASVLDISSSTCSLYSTAYVNISQAVSSNDLRYMENVCSATAHDRPSFCLPVERTHFKDCQAAFEDGVRDSAVYTLTPEGGYDSFDAWCDFDHSHGWTVFQRRQDGSVNFNLNWADYKAGFGNLEGEYWLGNDNLYALTQTNRIMNVYLKKYDGSARTANYSTFYINDENDNYRLTVSGYSGDADDSIAGGTGHTANGLQFSTPDNDNDAYSDNCAYNYHGAWWYGSCHHANLNGIYTSGTSTDGGGIVWAGSWSGGHSIPMHETIMRLTRN